MTTLDTAPVPVVTLAGGDRPTTPPPSQRRRLTVGVAAGIVLMGILIVAFNGPIAQLWYQSRQHHLVHDIGVARAQTHPGQALANLQIPVIGLNLVIGQGDNASQLRAGPGHRIGSTVPGALGNSLVFGHRHGWGGPFASLGKLKVGDEIFVQARLGQPTLFVVTSVKVVSLGDTRLLDPSTDYRLTLVTGTGGGYFSSRRLIVTAVSGTNGHLRTPGRSVPATAPRGSLIFNRMIGALLLLSLSAAAAARGLRGHYRPITTAIVVSPLVATALLALLLELDLLLPPLH